MAHDPTFAPQNRLTTPEDQLEPKHEPLRAGLGPHQHDTGRRKGVKLSREQLVHRLERPGDPNGNGPLLALLTHRMAMLAEPGADGGVPSPTTEPAVRSAARRSARTTPALTTRYCDLPSAPLALPMGEC
jgi:hypothetical protein